jgi:hypothetical protein
MKGSVMDCQNILRLKLELTPHSLCLLVQVIHHSLQLVHLQHYSE